MWIKQLRIQDFQSHADTVVEFHPNYNCFVGVGNSGKTSIIRALAFILFGQWDKSWVRHNADFCRITLTTNDDIVIIREKGEKVNRYIVRKPNVKEQIYESFGIHVPSEIEQLLQIFRVQIDEKDLLNLNMSDQHDEVFLLNKPGSFKAKLFGKLSGGHYLDYALRELNKDKRSLSEEKHIREVERLELQKELVQFENIPFEKQYLETLGQRIQQIMRKVEFVQKLKLLNNQVSHWKQQYTDATEKERKFAGINWDKTKIIDDSIQKISQLKSFREKLLRVDQEIIDKTSNNSRLQDLSSSTTQLYKDTLGTICPTCDQPLSDEQKEHLTEQFK